MRKWCGVSQKWWMLELSNLCHCIQHPWKSTSRHFWSCKKQSKPLSMQKYVLWKCCGVSQKSMNARSFQTFAIVFSTPENILVGNSAELRNERKLLYKQKCVLRKWCGVSQKWWMLEIPNICHCIQHPWKSTSRHFWSCKKQSKPLSMQKYILWKCCGISQKWWMLEHSNLCHCVQHPWKLTNCHFGSFRNERKSICTLKQVWENAVRYLRNSEI